MRRNEAAPAPTRLRWGRRGRDPAIPVGDAVTADEHRSAHNRRVHGDDACAVSAPANRRMNTMLNTRTGWFPFSSMRAIASSVISIGYSDDWLRCTPYLGPTGGCAVAD